jgi:hypothetical protein
MPTPVLTFHRVPTLTRERYEQVVSTITGGKSRFELRSDLPYEGLLVHVAAETDGGFLIFDVFESQEALDRFRAEIGTIARDAGITEPAQVYPTHTFVADQ